jgi:hypothetical protein
MPIRVISEKCGMCPRLKVIVEREYKGSQITETDIECEHYDDCLNALDMWQRGQTE